MYVCTLQAAHNNYMLFVHEISYSFVHDAGQWVQSGIITMVESLQPRMWSAFEGDMVHLRSNPGKKVTLHVQVESQHIYPSPITQLPHVQ